MSDIEKGRYDPPQRERTDELPTAYGGKTDLEPREPGQSLGRVPDPDDADVDEAGDQAHREAEARRADSGQPADIDTTGTTARPETP
ncbi:MAG: hypothetical protein ABWZ82_00115 [Candidatus Limnocylindrales bacterium]